MTIKDYCWGGTAGRWAYYANNDLKTAQWLADAERARGNDKRAHESPPPSEVSPNSESNAFFDVQRSGTGWPGIASYGAAVADVADVLAGSNVEAARAQLRSLVGTVPVFAEAGKLYGRVGFDCTQLLRSTNPGVA